MLKIMVTHEDANLIKNKVFTDERFVSLVETVGETKVDLTELSSEMYEFVIAKYNILRARRV